MQRMRWCLMLMLMGLVATTMGCGASQPPPVDEATDAQAKVEAFKKLADSMAKDPNGVDARVALEDFRNHALDVSKNRKEAEEIVEIYRQKIKGKSQGEMAQEVQMEITPIENALKTAKR